MPIISVVGRKQRKTRALITALYIVLSLGAVTMVYPFLLMVSTSFASQVDQNEFKVIPRYFYNDAALYRKYVDSKYNEDPTRYNAWFGTDYPSFETLEPPRRVNRKLVMKWRSFVASLPPDGLVLGHASSLSRITPEMVHEYRVFAQRKFKGNLASLNRAYMEANETWMDVYMPAEDWSQRNFNPERKRKYLDYLQFKESRPARYRLPVPADGLYQEYLRLRYGDIAAINRELGTAHRSRAEIHLSARVPAGPSAESWEDFVRSECPVQFIRIDAQAAGSYRQFLRRKYATIEAYNQAYGRRIRSFDELEVPRDVPPRGIARVDWIEFAESDLPIAMIELRTPEVLFRRHLAAEFGTVSNMNRRLGTRYTSFEEVSPPYAENDFLELKEDRRAIRREFLTRNYREVVEYIILHGRALLNTAILCLGMVLGVLTVNPLCAYALSRFNLRSTYKILLFLLATMAFPAEVSAIPSFLLIKDLHLMGTYWAIILPGLANGYSIFLLKGFFDSLPKELYESATIDGATEMQMYRKITLQLSKPVLAVISLGTFTAAYGSFMWAFLVLQNPKMWTLMVWLYEMQFWAPQFMVYAALVLAAIPTLLVFIFCQNIIMRGIIIPSEK